MSRSAKGRLRLEFGGGVELADCLDPHLYRIEIGQGIVYQAAHVVISLRVMISVPFHAHSATGQRVMIRATMVAIH